MTQPAPLEAIERALIHGDLSKLDERQRLTYYRYVCESLGLNPLTRPFDYLWLNGRLVLYANRSCADQLRQVHGVTTQIVSQQQIGDLYVVHVRARTRDGREDEDIGTVPTKGLQGEALANAILKAVTKAKRRVTLSICGLGWLDETEVDTVPGAQRVPLDEQSSALLHAEAGDHDQLSEPALWDQLSEKQRGYLTGLCRRYGIDPQLLVEAHGCATREDVSKLIDFLRTADQVVASSDQAMESAARIADRFDLTVAELEEELRNAYPNWDGDWGALRRYQLFWLEVRAYELWRLNQQAQAV